MPIKSFLFAVTSTAAQVVHPTTGAPLSFPASASAPVPIEIDNTDGTQAVYWGGSDVTTTTGSTVAIGAKSQPILYPQDQLYLIGAGSSNVRIIAGRQ